MMNEIPKEQAYKLAKSYLLQLESDSLESINLILLEKETIEGDFGWVFFYNSKEYIESGDFSCMLMGNAPFIVDKNSGKIEVTGTAEPIEFYIKEYRNRKHNKK